MNMSWQKKEEYVRKVLSKKFGVKLKECKVPLRGTTETYKFDLVSPDRFIVGEVKGAKYKGGNKSTALARLSDACMFLLHAEGARKRLLVLTEKSLYDLFISERQGQMVEADGIEIMLMGVKKHEG